MSANNPGLLERQCRVLQCSKTANLLFTIKQYIVGRTNRRSWGTPLYSTEMRVRFASHPQQPCDSRGVSANEDSFLKSSLSVAASRKRASIPGVCTRAPADILIKVCTRLHASSITRNVREISEYSPSCTSSIPGPCIFISCTISQVRRRCL